MSTEQNFSVLLKEYANNEIILNQVEKINWFLKKVKKDNQWGLGPYSLPVETQENSRFEWGAIPVSSDIPGAKYAKPQVQNPAELFGSLKFTNKDLERHDGDMKKSFLSITPGKIKQFAERMDERINLAGLGDGSLASLTATGTAAGVAKVDRIGIFTPDEKVTIKNNSTSVTGYVSAIDINAKTFKLVTAAGGSTGVDLLAYTVASGAKVYVVGATTERLTSLIDIIFPLSMGGADALYSGAIVKASTPMFQPFVQDLSTATTAAALLSAVYSWYYDFEDLGRAGQNKEVLVSLQTMKVLAEAADKGGKRQLEEKSNSTVYGSKSVTLTGPFGDIVIRGARGINNGYMMCVDWDDLTLASRGALIKPAAKMGDEFFRERASTGYTYIADKKFEAELIAIPGKHAGAKIATSFTA